MKTLKLHELKDQLEEILDLVENDEEQEENIDKNTVFLDGVSTPEKGVETVTAEHLVEVTTLDGFVKVEGMRFHLSQQAEVFCRI